MECWRKRTFLERKSLVTLVVVIAAITILITIILLVSEPQMCYSVSCVKSARYILNLIDLDKNPCQDFRKSCKIHSQEVKSVIDDAKIGTAFKIHELVSEPIRKIDTKTLQLEKKFFQACIDVEAMDVDNGTSLTNLMRKVGGWPVVIGNNWNESAFDFVELMVELRNVGLQHDWFLDISVFSNLGRNIVLEINVPDNVHNTHPKLEEKYLEFMVDAATAFGANENVAKSQMPEVLYFANKLADLVDDSHDKNELLKKPPQLISIAEVQIKWQKINWLELLNQITKKKLSEEQKVVFYAQNYMPKLDKLLRTTTKRTQVNYVLWKLVETYAPFLSATVRDLSLNYLTLSNQSDLWYKDRDAFCLEESRTSFQYGLESAFVRRIVPVHKQKKIEEIVERILKEMEEHLHKAEWMTDETKTAAISKLQNLSYIIGGPEEMYYAKQFDDDFGVGKVTFNSSNIVDILSIILRNGYDTLYNRSYDEKNYLKHIFYESVTSQEIKFFHNFNLLWLPAGALHELIYEEDRPDSLNYGILGTVIAQKLIFNIFNEVLRSTSSVNTTSENFRNYFKCLDDCFDTTEQIDCQNNLLEDASNYVGLQLAHAAYKKWSKRKAEPRLPGLDLSSDQLFWFSYGSLMCHLSDHMTQSSKINGPFQTSARFVKAFKCESSMNPRPQCPTV